MVEYKILTYVPADVLKNRLLMKWSLMLASLSSSSSDLSEASIEVQNKLMNQDKLKQKYQFTVFEYSFVIL